MRPATTLRHLTPSARPMAARRPHPPPPLTHPSSRTQGPSNPAQDAAAGPAMVPRSAWQPTTRTPWDRGGVDVNDLADQGETGRRRV